MRKITLKNFIVGLSSIIVPLIFIIASLKLSPWFSWYSNALSDLGHATMSSAAPLFNLGLLTSGALLIVYAITYPSKKFPHTSHIVCLIGFSTQLVAVFDEVYGTVHFAAAIATFTSIMLATLAYTLKAGRNGPCHYYCSA